MMFQIQQKNTKAIKKRSLVILSIVLLITIALFVFYPYPSSYSCHVTTENVSSQDIMVNNKFTKRYTGDIWNNGHVTVVLKGIKLEVYGKDNNKISEGYFDYKNFQFALAQQIPFIIDIQDDKSWTGRIYSYKLSPEYSCELVGWYK